MPNGDGGVYAQNVRAHYITVTDGIGLGYHFYDENGNLIDSDTDNTDQCVCTFTPRWTGRFTIRIKNLGRVYNRYTLYTN